jgi:hypothetical protein
MTTDTTLINFNAPNSTRLRFDKVCQLVGRTRTSVLVELMNGYVLTKANEITVNNQKIKIIDDYIGCQDEFVSHPSYTSPYDDDPPFFFTSTDGDGW